MPKQQTESGVITGVNPQARARVSVVTPVMLPAERFGDEGEIARGGASEVHRILDRTLLRRSAMKVLAASLQPYPDDRQRFIDEAQITAQLDHPNVVPIHELGLTRDGAPYFTMKLVEGETMEELLAARHGEVRQLGWVAAFLEILVKVCDAVAFAHSRGVIHRDLKPGNIMVGAFGQVYVMDWGIARLVDGRHDVTVTRGRAGDSLDQRGIPIGTPSYMPPEQAFGDHESTDERSDVFALGATLYHILTGHAPHEYNSYEELIAAARAGDVRPPQQWATAARLPRGLCRIPMRAMALDRRDRYASATELKEELVAQLQGGADLPRRTFAAGELVMREHEPGEAAYIIEQGSCRVFKTVDGEEVELRRMGPGEVFGETAILSAKPRTASVQALEPLTVRVVTSEELEEGVGMNTWVGLFVRTLAERFCEVDERLTMLESTLVRRDP
jgi:serine/threonine-protein kinase